MLSRMWFQEEELLYTVGGNAKWHSYFGKQFGGFYKTKHNIPSIMLLGTPKSENVWSHKKNCTWMFISTWFIIAKTWKKPRCVSEGKWISKRWYIKTMEYYSLIKKIWVKRFSKITVTMNRQIQQSCRMRYKMNISIVFLYTNNKTFEKK